MSESQNLLNTLRVRLKEIFDLERRLRELLNRLRAAEFPGAPHAATHSDGGADEVNVTQLGGFPGGGTTFLRDDGTFAAAGAGTPSATVAALDGVGNAGASTDYSRGDHKHADANRPTDDEKDALAGTGTPSGANPYVTADTLGTAVGGLVDGPGTSVDNAIARFSGTGGDAIDHPTPTPLLADDGRISTLTDPTALQDAATKNYVDTQIAALNAGGAAQNTFLVSGGQVVWVDDYDFIVSAATYYINGVLFSSPQTPITLDPADATDDRIDVIAVDDNGDVIFITGDPSSTPAEPDVDPSSQLKLAIVFVEATSTEPGGATTTIVYAENAGSPGEWNWSSSGSGWNLASTNNPRTGTIDIEATNVASGAFIQGQIGAGTFDPNAYAQLVLYIRSKANWTNNRTMQIRLQNAGAVVGQTLTIGNGQFGFDSSSTAAYQQIAIPISQFAVPAGQVITQVRLTRAGGSTIGFYLDDVSFVGGAVTQPATGITQAQADARYAPLGPTFIVASADPTLPNERVLTAGAGIASIDLATPGQAIINADAASLSGTFYPVKFTVQDSTPITTGIKRYTALIPPGGDGDITAWDLRSDPSANLVVNVRNNGSSITAGNDPELVGTSQDDDATLSGWTPAVVEGDVLTIDVDSNDDSEFFELQLVVERT